VSGKTILLTSHYMYEVGLCDRILIVDGKDHRWIRGAQGQSAEMRHRGQTQTAGTPAAKTRGPASTSRGPLRQTSPCTGPLKVLSELTPCCRRT
jgi:ABC-type multidrug transport system ATPase subunit